MGSTAEMRLVEVVQGPAMVQSNGRAMKGLNTR